MNNSYELFVIKKGLAPLKFTDMLGRVKWKSSLDTLGVELTFEIGLSKHDRYMVGYDVIEVGDKVVFLNGDQEVFRGIIVDQDKIGFSRQSYVAYDFAFYLNENETTAQFDQIMISEAIKTILKRFKIPHQVVDIPTGVSHLYVKKTLSDIIKDLLHRAYTQLGKSYRFEMRRGTLVIEEMNALMVKAVYKTANGEVDLSRTVAKDFVVKKSMKDLKNNIIVTSEKDKVVKVEAQAKDDESIAHYGMLQAVVDLNDRDISQVRKIAENELKMKNKVAEDTRINLLGHDLVRSGRVMSFDVPKSEVKGLYLIKEDDHELVGGIHKMALTIERWDHESS